MQFWHDLLEGTITSQMQSKHSIRRMYVEHVQHWIKNLEQLGNHFSKYFGQFNSLISLHNSGCTTKTMLSKSTVYYLQVNHTKILCVRAFNSKILLLSATSNCPVFTTCIWSCVENSRTWTKAWILLCLVTTCHSFSNRCSFMNCLRHASVSKHNRSSESWQMAEFTK